MTSMTATFTATLFSVTAVARRRITAIGAWHQAQKDYRALCKMDHYALNDLGLTPSDIRDATAIGYFADPTRILADRAAGHHRRRTNR